MSHNYTLSDLLEETSNKLKPIYKNGIDSSILSIVWGHTCIFIEEQLLKGKVSYFISVIAYFFFKREKVKGYRYIGTQILKPLLLHSCIYCILSIIITLHFIFILIMISFTDPIITRCFHHHRHSNRKIFLT